MSLRKPQTGFSAFEFIVIIVVIAIIGAASLAVYNRQHNKTVTSSQPTTSTSTVNAIPIAPTISSASDLDKATATLDQVDPSGSNSSDSSQLDAQLAAF